MSTIFNDGNEWHFVADPDVYARSRRMYEYRVTSGTSGKMLLDKMFHQQRALMQPRMEAMLYYHKPDNKSSPEDQAHMFSDIIGKLHSNEMIMLDTEVDCDLGDYRDFTRRWLAVAEERLSTFAWVYVPRGLKDSLNRDFTDHRIVKAPRYSGNTQRTVLPDWPYDVHQYTDRGPFPGSNGAGLGDVNFSELTIPELLSVCQRKTAADPWDSIFTQFKGA